MKRRINNSSRPRLNAFLKAAQDVSLFPELPTVSSYLPIKNDTLYADALKRLNQAKGSADDDLISSPVIASLAERRINSFYRNKKRVLNSKHKIFLGLSKVSTALENTYQTLGLNG